LTCTRFSPALLDAAPGHYDFQFAVLPPLIIDALLRIVTGRRHQARTGAWLRYPTFLLPWYWLLHPRHAIPLG
jgi:hypothetical protein